jgi:hypothetical protein
MSEELNIDEQIAAIDVDIEIQQWYVDRAKALKELQEDPRFQLVITDGYINVEADKVFNQLMNPQVIRAAEKEVYLQRLDAIQSMNQYLGTSTYKGIVEIYGENAAKQIEELMAMKESILLGKTKGDE